MEEQRLDRVVVGTEQHLLQALVDLATGRADPR